MPSNPDDTRFYSRDFYVNGDFEDDWLLEALAHTQRRLAQALQASLEHRLECDKCGTPECPQYVPPCEHTYKEGSCTRCGDQERVWCEHCGQEIVDEEDD